MPNYKMKYDNGDGYAQLGEFTIDSCVRVDAIVGNLCIDEALYFNFIENSLTVSRRKRRASVAIIIRVEFCDQFGGFFKAEHDFDKLETGDFFVKNGQLCLKIDSGFGFGFRDKKSLNFVAEKVYYAKDMVTICVN